MQEFIGSLLLLALVIWMAKSGLDWLLTHTSEVWAHILAWGHIYFLLFFALYLFLVTTLTKVAFDKATPQPASPRTTSLVSTALAFIIRPLIFFLVASLAWLRAAFLLRAVHYNVHSEWVPIGLAAGIGLLFAFWPTSSFKTLFYTAVLVHVRAIYLLVAFLVVVLSVLSAWVVELTLMSPVVAFFCGFGYVVYSFVEGTFRPSDPTHIALLLGSIAVLLMTARPTFTYYFKFTLRHVYGTYHGGMAVLHPIRTAFLNFYDPIAQLARRLGASLGGDIS